MTPIRVLVVDDSIVVRRLVSNVIDDAPDIEVAATAANGRLALDKLDQVRPDVVTLDIEMPELDGLATLREIRRRHPRLPVVMFSTLTERGAMATLDALSAGANDFVTKPANVGSVTEGMAAIREQLLPKLRILCGRPEPRASAAPEPSPLAARAAAISTTRPTTPPIATATSVRAATPPPASSAPAALPTPGRLREHTGPLQLVAIGVSTGGPNALAELWSGLSPLRVPIVIVQHMPPVFTAMLATRLDQLGTVPTVEATDGMELLAGHAYLAPGDHHLRVGRSGPRLVAQLDQGPPEHSCRPAVDPLFRSAVATFGGGVLAVVLTGMGSDGALGAADVRAAGGTVLAQDEASSVVWGMPGAVVAAGAASAVFPLRSMAAELVARAGGRRPASTAGSTR